MTTFMHVTCIGQIQVEKTVFWNSFQELQVCFAEMLAIKGS